MKLKQFSQTCSKSIPKFGVRISFLQRIFVTLLLAVSVTQAYNYELLRLREPQFSFVTSETSNFGGNVAPPPYQPRYLPLEGAESNGQKLSSDANKNTLPDIVDIRSRQYFRDEKDSHIDLQLGNTDNLQRPYEWPSDSTDATKSPKTIRLPPLPTLDVIEDPGYDHNRPTWPISEYLADKFNSIYRPGRDNKTNGQSSPLHNHQGYEWQQLRPSGSSSGHHHFDSKASGSSYAYDKTKYFHLDDDEPSNNAQSSSYRLRNNYNLYGFGNGFYDTKEQPVLSNAHEATVSSAVSTGGSSSVGTNTNVESSKSSHVKDGYVSAPNGKVPYFPPDYYPKKRFRLSIHPGYIAAPVAGLAAFGVASALTKKPVMFELGLVNNKYHYQHAHHHPHHGWGPHSPVVYPGGGYPLQHKPPLGPSDHAQFPVLQPQGSQHHMTKTHLSHHHHHHHHHHPSYPPQQHQHSAGDSHHRFPLNVQQSHHNQDNSYQHQLNAGDSHQRFPLGSQQSHYNHDNNYRYQQQQHQLTQKKPWWNPFAALTPRT